MSSSGGLVRRRVNAANASTSPSESGSGRTNNSLDHEKDPLKPEKDYTKPFTKHKSTSSTQMMNDPVDHKVGVDPLDLANAKLNEEHPTLTLMEEVILLGLKDRQGHLSFWNDKISYALRSCIILELALRGHIQMQRDNSRRRFALQDRLIELVDDSNTGEALLNETIALMKSSEKMSVTTWIDLLSGETWNPLKMGYQLKQVRERLFKGLVDKGILTTEKKNFLLFEMATHPLSDSAAKEELKIRFLNAITSKSTALNATKLFKSNVPFRALRTVCLICASYAAVVHDNILVCLNPEAREKAFFNIDELLDQYGQCPFAITPGVSKVSDAVIEEIADKSKDLQLEVVAAVIVVLSRLDSFL